MAVLYKPLGGNAGKITAWLIDRRTGKKVVLNGVDEVSAYCVEFKESNEPSESSKLFTNINDDLIDDFHGYRPQINFALVNANNIPAAGSINNVRSIVVLMRMINLRRSDPFKYRIKIQYRSIKEYGTINDAVFTGQFAPDELKADGNVAQKIEFEFKAAKTDTDYMYGTTSPTDEEVVIIGEEETTTVLCLEDDARTPHGWELNTNFMIEGVL